MIERRQNEQHAGRFDWVPGALAIFVTLLVALSQLTPYVHDIPEKNLNLIVQGQTTLWNGWLMILTYYFATTANARTAQSTIDTLAKTAQTAGTALAGAAGTPGDVSLKPGDQVTVAATDSPSEGETR